MKEEIEAIEPVEHIHDRLVAVDLTGGGGPGVASVDIRWPDTWHGSGFDFYGTHGDSVSFAFAEGWFPGPNPAPPPTHLPGQAMISRFVNATYGHTTPGRTNYRFHAGVQFLLYRQGNHFASFAFNLIENLRPGEGDERRERVRVVRSFRVPMEHEGVRADELRVARAVKKISYRDW